MTELQKNQIRLMREKGDSYRDIADTLGVSRSTIQSFCRRNGIGAENEAAVDIHKSEEGITQNPPEIKGYQTAVYDERLCRNCGKVMEQKAGIRKRFFCSKECRTIWWRNHPEASGGKPGRELVCPGCGKPFTAYWNKKQKYCSHDCYIKARFGGRGDE